MRVRLRLFGVPLLERDGVPLTGRAAQRHRVALLALLALAPRRRMTRDKLIACLWPESSSERGRNLLKVATYVLRSELGEDALLSSGDELGLNPAIDVDIGEFEAALERGDHALACDLYGGPFLDGFFLSDSPEFEQWASRERERLTAGFGQALEALAEAAINEGDAAAAIAWWRRRAVLDPFDSRVALRLMQSLEAGGNRAGAILHAAIHEHLLREELGVAAVPEVAAYAERLRTDPTPAVGLERRVEAQPVEGDAAPSAGGPSGASVAEAESPAGVGVSDASRRWWLFAAVIVALLAVAGAVRALWPGARGPTPSIVVLPFTNLSADVEDEYFSDGLTEEVITRLAALPALKVISRTSAMLYKGSAKPLPAIAQELAVDHVLQGSVRQQGSRVRISAQLVDAREDRHVWADNFEYELDDGFRVQERIAREVAEALEVRIGRRARRRLVRQGTVDGEAYDLHQRGRYLWNTRTREGHERAIEYYERAIERDSGYADPYAGIALAYLTAHQLSLFTLPEEELYGRARWATERALALDDESADAHLAFSVTLQAQRNWPGAERELRRAIDFNPGNATAHSWYSLLLQGMGRSDDAVRESRIAKDLDPFGIITNYNHGLHCYTAGDEACAIEQFGRVLEIAAYPAAWRMTALVHARRGEADRAMDAMVRAIEMAPNRPDFLADLAYVHALAGRTEEARAALLKAKSQPREPFSIARAHVALGEADSAFVWLERSSWEWPHRAQRNDPALDPIRSDPRFAQLSQRVDRALGMR